MAPRKRRRRSVALWVAFAALVAFAGAVAWVVHSASASYVRQRAENLLAQRLDLEVSINAVELGWFPPEVRILGLRAVEPGAEKPLFEVDRVLLEARWGELSARPRRLHSVRVERPRLRVEIAEDGSHNLPRLSSGPAGDASDRLAIGAVEVVDGMVFLGERRVPVDLALRDLRAHAAGAGVGAFAGSLQASDVEILLPTGATYFGAVTARGAWHDGQLTLLGGQLSGPDLRLAVTAGVVRPAARDWRLAFHAEGRLQLLESLGVDASGLDGHWHFDGELAGEDSWRLSGRVSSPRIEWNDLALEGLTADVAADARTLRLENVHGRFGGGALSGRVEARWAEAGGPVAAELRLGEGDLAALLAQVGLEAPGVGGRWSGSSSYTFGAQEPLLGVGHGEFIVDLTGRSGESLWARGLLLDVADGELRFMTTGESEDGEMLTASGRYALLDQRGQIDYRLDTERLGSWLELAIDSGEAEVQAWLPRAGLGVVEGSLLLSPAGWSSRLELQLREVLIGEITAPRVGGALTVSGRGVRDMRLDFVRPQGAMSVVGGITFDRPGGPAELDLRLEIDGWPGAELGRQLALPWSLEGSTSASVALGGTTEDPTGRARWTLAPGVVAGIPLTAIEGEVGIEPGALELERLDLRLAGSVLEVRGRLPLEGDGVEVTFESGALDLVAAPFDGWLPAGTRGTLSCAGRLEGSLESPRLTVDLDTDNVVWAGREATTAPTRLSVSWLDHRLAIEGSVGELLTIAGGGLLDPERADLDVRLESARLGGLLAGVVPGELAGLGGRFRGGIRLRGPLAGIEPEISFDELELTYGEHRLAALEPVTARWRAGALEISSLFLGDEATGSELFLFGRAPIDEAESLDLRLQASIDTRWLELLLPDWQFEGGRFEGLATVAGSFAAPLVNGQGEVKQERIRVPGLTQSVEQAHAVFLFYPGQVVIDDGEASFAGGGVRIAGHVEPFAEPALEYRFQVAGQDLQLRYPEGWQIRAGGDLVVSSVVDGRQIRGQVTLTRATFSEDVPVGITQLIQGAFERRPEVVEEADELLATTQLNIAVIGPEALRIRNNVADLRGDVDLVVRGNLARPVIFGDVRMEPGGTLLYSGNEYEVRRAELKFVNPYRIQPVVDLEATTRLREYDINLNLSGTLERLDVGFASNPPLAGLDVLSLLAGGQEPVASGDAGAGGAAESFLYGQATSVVAARVNRLFGLDKFRIDPLTGDSGDLSSARVTVGERLSRDLFATYSYDPSKTELQILQLEWQVSRQLTVVATQNGDSSYALDVRWEKSF